MLSDYMCPEINEKVSQRLLVSTRRTIKTFEVKKWQYSLVTEITKICPFRLLFVKSFQKQNVQRGNPRTIDELKVNLELKGEIAELKVMSKSLL